MSKFKVEERVVAYNITDGRRVGVMQEINGDLCKVIWVHPTAGRISGWYHIKQCRRLVKAPRAPK